VGGSTRMPKIKEILRNKFGENCKINDEINPDEVVAYGATIQAAMLLTAGQNNIFKEVNLYDITPITLGTDVINDSKDEKIKSLGSKMSRIIDKWTPIPAIKKKKYETIMDYQEDIMISIYEGEN
jgi:molecular chaperone DnaK (HSP70)